jgi:hypothetical protein
MAPSPSRSTQSPIVLRSCETAREGREIKLRKLNVEFCEPSRVIEAAGRHLVLDGLVTRTSAMFCG